MVGQGCPSAAVPSAGTASFPAAIAVFAAPKNAAPWQSANWPKGDPGVPLTHPSWSPPRVSVVPLNPNQTPTTFVMTVVPGAVYAGMPKPPPPAADPAHK